MAYGKHVHIGEGFHANFNLVLVDDGDIRIGDNVMIAPTVTISPAGHPVHPDLRRPENAVAAGNPAVCCERSVTATNSITTKREEFLAD